MIRFRLGLADLASTSFACSALQEAVLSLRMWEHPGHYVEQTPWFRGMRQDFDALEGRGLLLSLVASNRFTPDFLTPRPTTVWPDFQDELAALVATPAAAVRPDLERAFLPHDRVVPAPLAYGFEDPAGLLGRIADALAEYWDRCLAPAWWPRARSVLQADLVYRARMLAEGGADALFADLAHRLHWRDGELSIHWERPLALPRDEIDVDGRGLVLVPTCFARGASTYIDPGETPVITYPARGRATMAENLHPPPAGPALARLLGGPRARLLLLLDEPSSTTELARRLGVTAGAVSQHLRVLHDARLLNRARHGRVVLYARSALGDSLCR
ncbi:ArsR/SmtB family transcription factor [Actinacidiphila bryophytorum]|uniref:ArsR/SmtB family transcription factor n=1 Tax=Actinacidiphila bryophytorum TaxID=1436133 RepID=UPI002176CC19|nr:ArsR family transcriptional regulator [Actinacidiphila bryophytorum]UWE07481.1 ArsR family transcriptional regulator [Actinacidiphila bryophytorum]